MDLFKNIEVLTFDCYGTLIDWETGLLQALRPTMKTHGISIDDGKLLELYGELEATEERKEYKDYKSVLRAIVQGLGSRIGFSPSATEKDALARSLGNWPPFPDTIEALQALKRKYKLAVISNTDDDLFDETQKQLGVTFDWIITAEQVKSYKPSTNNFTHALRRIGTKPEHILHVAQSLYHDIPPARSVGMKSVWIDRRYKKTGAGATLAADATPDIAVPSLKTLARLMQVL